MRLPPILALPLALSLYLEPGVPADTCEAITGGVRCFARGPIEFTTTAAETTAYGVMGLRPGERYELYQDGAWFALRTADASGALFMVTAGAHQVRIERHQEGRTSVPVVPVHHGGFGCR